MKELQHGTDRISALGELMHPSKDAATTEEKSAADAKRIELVTRAQQVFIGARGSITPDQAVGIVHKGKPGMIIQQNAAGEKRQVPGVTFNGKTYPLSHESAQPYADPSPKTDKVANPMSSSGSSNAASGGMSSVQAKQTLAQRMSTAIASDNKAGNSRSFDALADEAETSAPQARAQVATLRKALPNVKSPSEKASLENRIAELEADLPMMESIVAQRKAKRGY